MIIFVYTFAVVFVAVVVILGVGGIVANMSDDEIKSACDDFIIEQDIVYTCDSVNL